MSCFLLLVGAVVGQILIPIPVVGFLLGGVVTLFLLPGDPSPLNEPSRTPQPPEATPAPVPVSLSSETLTVNPSSSVPLSSPLLRPELLVKEMPARWGEDEYSGDDDIAKALDALDDYASDLGY